MDPYQWKVSRNSKCKAKGAAMSNETYQLNRRTLNDHSIPRSGRAGDHSELPKGRRPKHLDLFKIRLPLPGIVSILHRVSSAVLFLFFVPLGLAALQGSLAS